MPLKLCCLIVMGSQDVTKAAAMSRILVKSCLTIVAMMLQAHQAELLPEISMRF